MSETNNPMNRRAFFKNIAGLAGAALLAPALLQSVFSTAQAEQKRPARPGAAGAAAGGGLALVDPNEPTAKAVKYVEDHTKAPEAKGNHCATCGFYAKKESKNGKEAGSCTIFQGKLVYANAYCSSWNKKA